MSDNGWQNALGFFRVCFALAFVSGGHAIADVARGEAAMRAGDFPLAIKELTPDAERGNAAAQDRLAGIYEALSMLKANEEAVAQRHLTLAFTWYSRAADQNRFRRSVSLHE